VQSAFTIAVTAGEDFDPRSHMVEDVATDDLVVGKYLTLTESGTCRAERYGYLSWNGARLELLSPLWIGERNLSGPLVATGCPSTPSYARHDRLLAARPANRRRRTARNDQRDVRTH
jgi:hypothetical protein